MSTYFPNLYMINPSSKPISSGLDLAEPILEEPFLNPSNNRLTAYPIKYSDIWAMYKKQRASAWEVEEVELDKDYPDFQKLSSEEQHFIKYVLAFFAGSDGLVNLNLVENFIDDVTSYEAKMCYRFQASMEDVHNEMYSLLLETLIRDPVEKDHLMNALETIPCIRQKGEWTRKWINSHDSFATRVFAFAIVEGVFFSGSFCSIYWIGTRNLMPGLIKSNAFISRDEGMHTDLACLIYSKLRNRLSTVVAHEIMKEAVVLEKQFINDALPYRLKSMNADLMSQYIEAVGDHLLGTLGYPPCYGSKNPFPFMEKISLELKNNIFEHFPSEYQKASVKNDGRGALTLSDEF